MMQTVTSDHSGGMPAAGCRLELYVAGDTRNSRRAAENLSRYLQQIDRPVDLIVVDVLKDPKAAFQRSIFATPSLIVEAAGRKSLIVGDLSEGEAMLRSLLAPDAG